MAAALLLPSCKSSKAFDPPRMRPAWDPSGGYDDDEEAFHDLRPAASGPAAAYEDTLRRWRSLKAQAAPSPPQAVEDRWVTCLKAFVGPEEESTVEEETEAVVLEHLRDIMDERASSRGVLAEAEASTSGSIPVFYKPKPGPETMAGRVRRLARVKFLKKQAEELLDGQELEQLWLTLRENCSPPEDEQLSERINYDDFCQAGDRCLESIGPKCRGFFAPSAFLMFEADEYGRIGILPFYLYIMRMTSLTQTRVDMSLFDSLGDGCLRPAELEAYIGHLLPTLPQLCTAELAAGGSFVAVYKKIAARKLFFFCDPQRRGRVAIRDMLLSPVFAELLELRQEGEGSQGAPAEDFAHNWFSLQSARRVYSQFLSLDSNMNGTLSKRELLTYGDGNLTNIFIERVFDEHVRRSKGDRGQAREMELGSFLDFVLALENKHTPEGLAYLFKCLDLSHRGYLTSADVYTLFKAVHKRWIEGGNYELVIEDVKDEIWDMVKPADPLRIRLSDLLACKQGATVASMLIDVGGFWQHDNRESLAQQEQDEEGVVS